MSGRKNTALAANECGGRTDTARRARMSTHIIARSRASHKTESRQTTTELARLRREYQAAVLSERWDHAAELQAAYHEAERRRRAELLRQAEVCYG